MLSVCNMKIIHGTIIILLISITHTQDVDESKVLYFGYASNLLAKRIQIGNPSAERYGIGKLKNYRLDILPGNNELWNGPTATIIEDDDGDVVWGAVWTINSSHIEQLDRGEGVHSGLYRVLHLPIHMNSGQIINCRVYQQVPNANDHNSKPSKSYMEVIVEGAIESGLPLDYIRRLNLIKHTDNVANETLLRALGKL